MYWYKRGPASVTGPLQERRSVVPNWWLGRLFLPVGPAATLALAGVFALAAVIALLAAAFALARVLALTSVPILLILCFLRLLVLALVLVRILGTQRRFE
jgi:hypothetical protein